MPGRHASPDRRRFRRDLTRLIVLALVAVIVVVGLVFAVRLFTGGGGPASEPAPVASDTTTPSTAAAPASAPSTTTLPAEGTSSTSPATTVEAARPTTTTAVTLSSLPPVREPGQIIVIVLNSTRVAGLAGRLTDRLSELGYRTEPPDNHPTEIAATVVWHLEGFEQEAEALAKEIPDADIEPFPGDAPRAHLTVVLGASYSE